MINNISRYLDLFVDIGKSMLESGAEIHRVEDSIYRLCDAYGMQQIEIFAIRSLIVVTVRDVTGQIYTDSKRIYELGIDMGQLEELNQLSRLICRDCPDDESIERMIAECRKKKSVSKRETMIGYILAASSFACFFGGRLRDGAAAAVLGLILFGFDEWVAVRRKQRFVYTVAVSMILGFAGMAWGYLRLGFWSDKIIIGTIMLLIPGMAFMNSVRDMLNDNEITGLFSCLDAVLTASAIAIGFAVPLIILGGV